MLRLRPQSLDWALAHVLRSGDTDVFPVPFEYLAIQHDWQEVQGFLAQQDVLSWTVRPDRMLLAPKARYGFRIITQLDPLDTLIFLALVLEVGKDLEAYRVPIGEERVFSYRFDPRRDGQLFSPNWGYSQFHEKTRQYVDDDQDTLFVGMADIADFYHRIYHHRLENALRAATSRTNHVLALVNLLSGWNASETFGIPVGNAACRLLSEIAISDVDEALIANGARFVRFSDDYRIFAASYSEAYRQIAFLAKMLFANHGMTLQPQKTRIVRYEVYRSRYLATEEEREVTSLRNRFEELADELGLNSWYEPIDYDDLDEDQQAMIDSMNLVEVFREEARVDGEPDVLLLRFILRRMSQLGDAALVPVVLDHIEGIFPVLPDIIVYFKSLKGLGEPERHELSGRLLELLQTSVLSELEYHRMWILDLFTSSTDWNQEDQFFRIYAGATDQFTRRKAILAMGAAGHRHWFQSQWRHLFDEPAWPRRAILAGASCLPPDARKHWYRTVDSRLDVLERAVARWAQARSAL